jgi:hypothetical protein
MANTHPDIGANTALLKSYMTIARDYVKRIDHKANLLADRLGLQLTADHGSDVTAIRQNGVYNLTYGVSEKTSRDTYTMTGLVEALERAPLDGAEIAEIFIALNKFADSLKTDCDALLSMVKDLRENGGDNSRVSRG